MKNQKGFSLFEVLFTLAFIGMAALIFTMVCGNVVTKASGMDHRKAQEEAQTFAQEMGLELVGATCQNVDSDADGYVSCTLRVREHGETKLLPVECAAALTLNHGCKLPARMMVQP